MRLTLYFVWVARGWAGLFGKSALVREEAVHGIDSPDSYAQVMDGACFFPSAHILENKTTTCARNKTKLQYPVSPSGPTLTGTVPEFSPHALLSPSKLPPLQHVHVHVDDAVGQLQQVVNTVR